MNMLCRGFVAKILMSIFTGTAIAAPKPTVPLSPKISPALAKQIDAAQKAEALSDTTIPTLVYMLAQADLNRAYTMESKAERGKFVYRALTATARNSQRSLIAWLKAQKLDYKSYHLGNAIAVLNATPEQIGTIAARPDVKRVVADPKVKIKMPETIGLERLEEVPQGVGDNIIKIGAKRVWDELGFKGQGIVIAGQDTGVQWDHPALKNQYRGWDGKNADHTYAWHDAIEKPLNTKTVNRCGYNLAVPCDDNAHGTHTIGTIVGDDGGSNKIGVAPAAKWIACRNMDEGLGAPHTYLECFEFFLAPYPQGGVAARDGRPDLAPHVINNSWGCDGKEGCDGSEFLGALDALKAAGIMVVASAGNSGPGCGSIESAPAHHTDETLAVGAHNHRNDSIASFSSRGPSTFDSGVGPDVTAPGVDVRSCTPGNRYAGSGWSGTSMAGPHVVGQVALMWSAAPEMIGNIHETIDIIRTTATPRTTSQSCGGVSGSATPNNTYGYGSINAFESVRVAKAKFGE